MSWSLVFGLWSLVFGLRSLVFGLRSSVFGLRFTVLACIYQDQSPKTKVLRSTTSLNHLRHVHHQIFSVWSTNNLDTDW